MTPEQAQAMIDAINRLADVANAIFAMPVSSELAAVWGAGFSVPLVLFLASHAVGQLVSMWRSHH